MDVDHPQRHVAATGRACDRWPPRAQRLIGGVGPLCREWLEPKLQQSLEHFGQELYAQAERSRSHFEQQRCFDSRAVQQQQRDAFMKAFVAELDNGLARMGDVDETPIEGVDRQPLSLLDHDAHELNAALEKFAVRGEAHYGPLLSELSYRFAVLVGTAPLEGEDLPIGPAGLAKALHVAHTTMDLPLEHRLLLLHCFEQTVTPVLGSLYETVNAQLVADGILLQLRPFAPPRQAPSSRTSTTEDAASTGVNRVGAAGSGHDGLAPIAVLETLRDLLAQRRVGTASPMVGRAATQDELQTALGALQQHLMHVAGQASRELRSAQLLRDELLLQLNADKPVGATPTRLSVEQDDTVELVSMLFDQLNRQMHQGPHTRALLGELQLPMLRMAIADRGFFDQQDHPARRLLGAVAEAANEWLDSPDGEADKMLVGKLHHLLDRAQREPPSAGLYTTLLADIEHQLTQLNRRAQAAERRHVEAMQGRERLDQARQRAIEALAERFVTHPPHGLLRALLDRAWADVLALTLLQHGEHSPAFAQRLRVTDQLLGRLPVDNPALLRREVEAGLQQIGMHASEAEQVALRLISGGEEPAQTAPVAAPATASTVPSKATKTPAAAAPHIETNAPVAPPAEAAPQPKDDMPVQATEMASTEAPVATTQASAPVVTPMISELPSATDLALRLKQRQRLGEHQHTPPAHAAADAEPPLGPQEARIHNRLRQLPYGSWFEFTDQATGETTRRKLAWFSPLTGNSLFVTRRGQRGEEMNLRELARAMVSGRVREMPPEREGLLDRAWRSLTGTLVRSVQPTPSGIRP